MFDKNLENPKVTITFTMYTKIKTNIVMNVIGRLLPYK